MSSNSLNVDQRIVQMEFDNAQFEQGVGTSLKSLDKLKNSLDFAGQKNSVDGLSKSMKSFSAAPLVSSLSAAKSGFSALEVAGITVISNITSKIQMMGERLVSAVTIDPVKSGWTEYEQKMDSIKTILNSAKDKNGAAVSLDQVKKKIEELNVYADKTIYSFSDMTKNIGKFTNAGVDLDTATAAIQGVANAAAAAGADSNAASRAMYNFAQSLSVGYMQRIDWKSIENANMATVEFKDELLKTAVAMGTVKKTSDGMYMSLKEAEKKNSESSEAAAMFTEKLKDKWLTNDVLIETLNRYSDANTKIGKKAQEAATKVFTLSKMFDTLREAMQSGWSATWEKIVGDYDQAGKLFTGINDYLSGIINASADKRIKFLDELLNQKKAVDKEDWNLFKFGKDEKEITAYENALKQAARDTGINIDKMINKNTSFSESLKNGWLTDDIFKKAKSTIKDYKKELSGKKKDTFNLIDPKTLDTLDKINKEQKNLKNLKKALNGLGEAVDSAGKKAITKKQWQAFKFGKDKNEVNAYKKALKQAARDTGIDIDNMIKKNKSFAESLKEGWLTNDVFKKAKANLKDYEQTLFKDEQKAMRSVDPKTYKKLVSIEAEQSDIESLNSALKELAETTDKTGRELLVESFKAVFEQITRVYENIKRAYEAVFPKASAAQLYELIQRIRDYTKNFEISITTIYRVRDAFKGLFSVVKLVINIGKTAFDLVVGVIKRLRPVGKMVLDIAAGLGRMADSFRKNYEKGGKFKEIVDVTLESMDKLFQKIKELTQGKAISMDDYLNFKEGLSKKDEKLYEKVIKRIAREHGVNVDKMIEKNGSFEKSLKEGWFTKDIFNEVNYYLDNISNKKRKGPAIYTKEEYNSLKSLRKSLEDTDSAWAKLGETAGKTGAERFMAVAEKVSAPFENVFDVIIGAIPKIVGAIGTLGKIIGFFLFGRIKTVYKILKIVFTTVYNFFKTNGKTATNVLKKVWEVLKKLFKTAKDVIKKVIDKAQDKLPKVSDVLKKITDHLKELKEHVKKAFKKVKEFVEHLLNLVDVQDVVGAIAGFFAALAGLTFGGLIFAIDAITKLFTYLSGNKYVAKIFTALTTAVTAVAKGLTKGIGKIKTFVTELLKLDGVKQAIENIKTFFENLGIFAFEKAKTGFETIGETFKLIGDKLPSMETVLQTINGLLDGTVDKFKTIKDIFSKGIEVITSVFKPEVDTEDLDEVEDNAKGQKKSLGKSGDMLKTALENFTKDIESGLENLNSAKILKTGALIGLVYIVWQIGGLVKNFKQIFKNMAMLTSLSAKNPIAKFVNGLVGALSAWRKQTDANIVYTLAKAVGVIAISLVALTKVAEYKNIDKATAAIFWTMIGLSIMIRSLGKAFGASSGLGDSVQIIGQNLRILAVEFKVIIAAALKLISLGAAAAMIAVGVAVLVGAFIKLYKVITQENVNWPMIGLALLGIATFILLLEGAVLGLTKMKGNIPAKAAVTILAFAFAVGMIANTLIKLSKVKGDFDQGLGGVLWIIGSLTVAFIALKKWASSDKTDAMLDISTSLLIFAIAIRVVAGAVIKIAEAANQNSGMETALLGIIAIMVTMAGAMGLLGKYAGDNAKDMLTIAASMIVFAVGIGVLVKALEPLSKLNGDQFIMLGIGFAALVGAMVILGMLGNALDGLMPVAAFLASIGVMAAGVGVGVFLIVAALKMLGPALNAFVDGLLEVSQKIQENGDVIAGAIATLIAAVCTAIIVRRQLLKDATATGFGGLLEGIETALMKFLPKGKLMMALGIATIIFVALGTLETIMPGAVDKILGIIVTAMYSLAAAITNHSHGLVGGIGAILNAIYVLFLEIVQTLYETFYKATGGLGGLLPDPKEGRAAIEDYKKQLLEEWDNTKESRQVIDTNEKNNEEVIDSASPDVPPPVPGLPTPGAGSLTPSTPPTQPSVLQQPSVTGQTPEEAYETNYEVGEASITGYDDAINAGIGSIEDTDLGGLSDKLNSLVDENGLIDKATLMGTDFSAELGDSVDFSILEDKSYSVSDLMGTIFNPETGSKLGVDFTAGFTKSFNLDGASKKAEETGKDIEKKGKEAAKEAGKSETVTKKTTVKQEMKVDNSSSKATMKKDAEDTASTWQKSFSKKAPAMKTTVVTTVKEAAKGAGSKSVYNEFKSSASYSANGALNGLESKMGAMYDKGVKMGKRVNDGYRSVQLIKSPSRLMYRNALYTVQGLLNGFSDNEKSLFKAGSSIGGSVNSGAKRALAQMSSSLANGIDSTPTIRPVLDLSDVEAGARSINGMLGGRTLSVGSLNANRLATSMNARQNGTDPVIAAINNLANNLSATPSNTYNINGITYDDGSNIANAIGMLTRAAIVEGRA